MKPRGQTVIGDGFDGFDRNVAEKMPKIRKEEESPLSISRRGAPSPSAKFLGR